MVVLNIVAYGDNGKGKASLDKIKEAVRVLKLKTLLKK